MPFVKGQSGNPGGRVKNGESLRDVLRASLTPEKKKKLAEMFYELAMAGDTRAIGLLYDNYDGKLPNRTEITGGTDDDGNEKPIPIKLLPPA